jgi:hypothetical protein
VADVLLDERRELTQRTTCHGPAHAEVKSRDVVYFVVV